jgi:hypothetical protein
MDNTKLDSKKSDAFAEKMIRLLNSGALALMTSIGHQTGIFDSLKGMPPATSDQIASESGLNERYVREWLGAMVTRYNRMQPERASIFTSTRTRSLVDAGCHT